MLSVSTFGNTADIYAIVHLVPHACQHIAVDGHTCYYWLLAENQGNYVRELFLKETWEVSLSIGVRFTMIRCVVYLLLIFKMFHGLMNNLVYYKLGSYNTDVLYYKPAFFSFCKYWPDDGFLRPKLVANITVIKKTYSCVRRSTYLTLSLLTSYIYHVPHR
jgi:hypothetical protein